MKPFEDYYCHFVQTENDIHKAYHDTIYGFPASSDNELFKRLVLEINQAGLSWTLILKKRSNFELVYDNFDIDTVANYGEADRERLRNDPRIIRNRLKINAAIHNAQVIQQLQKEYGSFKNWLDSQFPKTIEAWVKLFKKTFKFTGGEITKEFLMGTGYIKGAHHPDCPIYEKVLQCQPKWLEQES